MPVVGDGLQRTAAQVAAELQLQPHPEGGWYRELHRSEAAVQRWDGEARSGLTLIVFLLAAGETSGWHRVLHADETWHFAGGEPLALWVLEPGADTATRRLLGPLGLGGGASEELNPPVAVVPAGWWQAARSMGRWSLVTCCVGPGFDFQDFQLLRQLPRELHPLGAMESLL